jgi:hypothetical protein
MNLQEYFDEFRAAVKLDAGLGLPVQVAAEVAAGHAIGLTVAQMHAFLTRRTQLTSVAFALRGPLLSAEQIGRIDLARAEGAVFPKDVILKAFTPEELRPDVLDKIAS